MADEADDLVAEYKKLGKKGPIGDNSLSVTDRLMESIFGKYKKMDAERKKKEEDAEEEKKRNAWREGL